MNENPLDRHWNDRENWTWGILYHAKADPRVLVPRRYSWGGWTFNFGHPKAGLAVLASMLLAVGPALLALALFRSPIATYVAMAVSLVALFGWAVKESNRTQ